METNTNNSKLNFALISFAIFALLGIFLFIKNQESNFVFANSDFNTKIYLSNDQVKSRIESQGSGLEFTFLNHKLEKVDAKTYENSQMKLSYEVIETGIERGLKETITLKENIGINEFAFQLNLNGVAKVLPNPEKRTWHFYDSKDKELFYIPAGFMIDAKGIRSENVQISASKENTGYLVKVTADKTWLDDPSRAYPVDIDPSVIVSGGIVEADTQFGGLQRKVAYVSGSSGITYVQSQANQTTPTSSQSQSSVCISTAAGCRGNIVFDTAPTAGNLLVVATTCWNIQPHANAVSDNQGNTYTQVEVQETSSPGDDVFVAIYYAKNITSSGTFTVTFNCDNNTGNDDQAIAVHEYSGADPTDPFDQSNSASGTNSTPNSGNVTTSTNGQLYFGAMAETQDNDMSIGAGYIVGEELEDNSDTNGILTEYKIGNAQTTSAGFGLTGSNLSWAAAIATFKPAPGSNWYAFYSDASDVFYKKSSDGSSWGSAVEIDATDNDNYNPSIWFEGNDIYVTWIDDSGDAIEVNTVETDNSDTIGTKCTSSDQGTIDTTSFVPTIAVADNGTVYVAYSDTSSDTEAAVYKLTYSGCSFTNITTEQDTLDLQVSASADDAWNSQNASGTGIFPTDANALIGIHAGQNGAVMSFFRFTGVSGLSGATINSATFKPMTHAANSGTPLTNVYADDAASPTAPTTSTDARTRTLTSAFTAVDNPSVTPDTRMSIDVTTVVQELADSYDPSSILILWRDDGSGGSFTFVNVKQYDDNASNAAELDITYTYNASGLTAGDRPVLVTMGNNLHVIFQDGNLSHSVYNGTTWTTQNTTIDSDTDSVYSLTTDGTNLYLLTVDSSTDTAFYKYTGSWSSGNAPWTGQTNITSVSIAYDSTNSDLYAVVVKDTSEQAYQKLSDATTISWGAESSYNFTAGDLGNVSLPLSGAGLNQLGIVLRQGSNFEFSNQQTPLPQTSTFKGGGTFRGKATFR